MHTSSIEANHLRIALEALGIGTWKLDISTGLMYPDNISFRLFGVKENDGFQYSVLFENIHPENRNRVRSAIEDALHTKKTIDIKYRTLSDKPDNGRWVHMRGKYIDGQGTGSYTGTIENISAEMSTSLSQLESEYRYRSIIEKAPFATALYVGRDLIIEIANDIMLGYWGKDSSVIGSKLDKAIPELEGQPFVDILKSIFDTGEIYQVSDAPVVLASHGVLGTYYFDFTYKPLYDSNGEIYAIMNMAVEVTERVMSRREVQQSEARFRAITEQSPMAIGLLKGEDMVIEIGNDKIFEVWGKDSSITGLPLIDALPELRGQPFLNILSKVYTTGNPYYGYDVPARLEHKGVLKEVYFDFVYSALKGRDGTVNGVLVMANDVTERVETLRKIAASEAKFRALMDAAPAAMILFVGKEDMIIDTPNQAMLDYIGRDESINGKPLLEAVPEISGSESLRLIKETFETGIKSETYGRQVKLVNKGVVTQNYYNVTYTPLFDANGDVYAVLDTAIDVTESIKARKAIEEAEASLRGAIELADLGTWSLDPKTFSVDFSERMLQWHGLNDSSDNTKVFNTVHENDRERISNAVTRALTPGLNVAYDEIYTIINQATGRERILHAQGKAFFNEAGEPYIFMGTAQDITNQRQLQLALENEVRERTQELQVSNRDLEDANRMLLSSNEELAQYAYVASHDLQEPLRKITMYSNLLSDRDTEDKYTGLIDKIIRSSRRMSLLIKDLLEFSRLLNTEARFVETNLNTIVHAVRDDFELLIQEKDATIEIGDLPVINAVPLQMNQLFYNLISNGLKFVPKDRLPRLQVKAGIAHADCISSYIHNPLPNVQYHLITVSDNGIGIEEQYEKQIFEVFKRLHGRDEYSGSGIGLAICRRIAVNHKGAIFTESEVGKGTTFNIILPGKQ